MREFIDKIKRYFRFSATEIRGILFSSLIIGFIVYYGYLSRAQEAVVSTGVITLIFTIIMVIVSVFIHISAQKAAALHRGYQVEFKMWWSGIIVSLAVVLVSRGAVWWIVLPGGVVFSMLAQHRLGQFRYGLNYWPIGWIALLGPVASLVFGGIFKNINLYLVGTPIGLFDQIFLFNLVYAACSMIPLPPLDGHFLFYASRSWFVIIFATLVAYTTLALLFGSYTAIWAIVIGLIAWLIYYIKFEKEAWMS